MFLSILIPTYDCSCYPLVAELHRQVSLTLPEGEAEIIVIDDGSHDQVSAIANHKINDLAGCRYIRNKQNIGRAAVRNLLADTSQGEWLLFIDSDAKAANGDYISNYVRATKEHPDVVRGGIQHADVCHDPHRTLRWKYERHYERKHGRIGEHFTTFNFLIRRDVFMSVRFDETYRGYGGEDTKFGIDLKDKGYGMTCIDNALIHTGLDTNSEYLHKVEAALLSLHRHRKEQADTKILTFIRNHRLWAMATPILFRMLRPLLRHNLLGKNPDMTALSFYKLGYYLTLSD